MDTGGFFFRSTAATHVAGYSPPSSADVNMWSCTSSPLYAFTAYPGMALTLPLTNYTVLNSKQDNL